MRIRHVEDRLTSELIISQNQYWGRHRSEVEDEPVASLEDVIGGRTASRSAPRRSSATWQQLKQFMDQAGRLWQEGKLADKVATAFTASMTTHGGQESTMPCSTLYHCRACSSSRSVTRRARCSTPGATRTAPRTRAGRGSRSPDEKALAVARYQGRRLARYARGRRRRPRGGRLPRQAAEAGAPEAAALD